MMMENGCGMMDDESGEMEAEKDERKKGAGGRVSNSLSLGFF